MSLFIKSILFTALFFYSNLGHACSCADIETFCETITFGNNGEIDPNYSIMRIKVDRKTNHGIEVKVIEMLQGTESRNEIEIISGNGANCGISTDIFNKGDELLVVFWMPSDRAFMISGCGVNFLRIKNETLRGKIAPGVERIAYRNLAKLKKCGSLDRIGFSFPTLLFPNPVHTEAELRLEVEAPLTALVNIISTSGRNVKQLSLEYDKGTSSNTIPVNDLPKAMYFIEINIGAQRKVLKLLVQ